MINIVNTEPDEDDKTFHACVHKDVLCYYSSYYTAALKGGFSEAKQDTVTMELPEYQMRNLVQWLYTGTLISDDESELAGLYFFADEKMMLAMRRSIMSRMVRFHGLANGMDSKDAMSYLHRLPQNSDLFRWLVDHFADLWIRSTDSMHDMETLKYDERVPRAFFYQALSRLTTMVRDGDRYETTLDTPCNFHEHLSQDEWRQSTLATCPFTHAYSCADSSSVWSIRLLTVG